jgi:hypothetical protein
MRLTVDRESGIAEPAGTLTPAGVATMATTRPPAEIPQPEPPSGGCHRLLGAGVLTAVLGTPYFRWLLVRTPRSLR